MRESAEKIEVAADGETSSDKETREFFENLPRADAVVVLGGELKIQRGQIEAGLQSKMRTLAALELLRKGVVKKMLLSGGKMKFPASGVEEMPEISIAEAMEKFLEPYLKKYGISSGDILLESESINTTQNLENSLKILKESGLNKFYLETNEYHLGRGGQILRNILAKETGLELAGVESAEELLKKRSPHYEKLVSYFQFPDSLKKAPQKALTTGLRELLRRTLIYCPGGDRIATFVADIVRRRN